MVDGYGRFGARAACCAHAFFISVTRACRRSSGRDAPNAAPLQNRMLWRAAWQESSRHAARLLLGRSERGRSAAS